MLVLATADWVIPVITGVIGLLGVLIGALVGGALERKQLESRDRRQLCIAARLLYDELTTNRATVETMRTVKSFFPMKTELWTKVRSDLAAPEIDIDDFKFLTIAYIQIEVFSEGCDETSEWEKIDGFLNDDFVGDLKAGIAAVAKYAGETEEGIAGALSAYDDESSA
jgi:hypothetical protein